jgi:hypothetical protein
METDIADLHPVEVVLSPHFLDNVIELPSFRQPEEL